MWRRRIHVIDLVWIGLVVATCWSWLLGSSDHALPGLGLRAAAVMILGTAMIKIRFVIRYFMEVHAAPVVLRIACDAWLLIVGGGMVGLYLAAPV